MAATDGAGRTVSDQMMYNLNPSAVQSSIHMKTINCDGGNVYKGGLNSKIIFTVPHIPGGEYWNPAESRFRCVFRLHLPAQVANNALVKNEGEIPSVNFLQTTPLSEGGYVDAIRLERGIESMIRRIEFKDQSGQLIESLENYNLLYAITEICHDDPDSRQNRGSFNLENCASDINTMGAFLWPPEFLKQYTVNPNASNMVYRDFEITFNTVSSIVGSNSSKVLPLSAINGVRIEITLEDPSGCLSYTSFPHASDAALSLFKAQKSITSPDHNTLCGFVTSGVSADNANIIFIPADEGRALTHAPQNPPAGATYDLSYDDYQAIQNDAAVTINTTSRYLTADEVKLVMDGPTRISGGPANAGNTYNTRPFDVRTKTRVLPDSLKNLISYELIDPVYQMSTIVVPPAIDLQIRQQGQQLSPDGRIRLQGSSWQQFSTTMKWDETYMSYTIPIHVASLKSLFFTITPNHNFQDFNTDRSQFIMRNLQSYNFKLNGENILSSPARVQYPYSEAVSELMRAWSIGGKDAGIPTMLNLGAYGQDQKVINGVIMPPTDAIFAIDLESFNSKSAIMDSGINVRNSSLMFEANFKSASARDRVEWGERQTITFYALYDMYVSIDATTGMLSYEN